MVAIAATSLTLSACGGSDSLRDPTGCGGVTLDQARKTLGAQVDRISPDDAGKKGDSCEYATTDSSIDIYRAKKGTPMEGVPVSELPDSSYVADMDTLGVKVSGRIWILMITSDSSRAERKQMMIEIAQKIVAAQT